MKNPIIVSALILSLTLPQLAPAFAAETVAAKPVFESAEFNLLEKMISLSGASLNTQKERDLWQAELQSTLKEYEATASNDPEVVISNFKEATRIMGVNTYQFDQSLVQLQNELIIEREKLGATPSQAEINTLQEKFANKLANSMSFIHMQSGAQFSMKDAGCAVLSGLNYASTYVKYYSIAVVTYYLTTVMIEWDSVTGFNLINPFSDASSAVFGHAAQIFVIAHFFSFLSEKLKDHNCK